MFVVGLAVLELGSLVVLSDEGTVSLFPGKGLLVGAVGTRSCGATRGSGLFTRTLRRKSILVPSKTDVIGTYH